MKTQRLLLNGLGNVGRRFLELLRDRGTLLRDAYGIDFRLVGAVDSRGALYDPAGLDPARLVAWKLEGRSVAELPGGEAGQAATCLLKHGEADLVLEAAPTNFWNGQPGLDVALKALAAGLPVVMASKGPLVLAFEELAALSDWRDPRKPALRFSGAVGGALPSVNLGRRDLAGAKILKLEGVLNLCCPLILADLERGLSMDEAITRAQALGLLETDPSLDIDGHDAAAKLVILAQAVLNQPARMADVCREGIRGVTPERMAEVRARGRRLVMLARAEREGEAFRLSVGPTELELDHPLARLEGDAAGIVYDTDIQGRQACFTYGQGPMGTAAAMLRDALEIAQKG